MGTISEQCFTNDRNSFKAFKLIKFLVPLAFSVISQACSCLTEWQELVYCHCHAVIKVKAVIAR